METLLNDYNALLASGKTPIGLNQWVKTDKPMMEDFNEDNRVIDAAIRGLEEGKADKDSPEFSGKITVDGAVVATAAPVSSYLLPVVDGLTTVARYWATQDGELKIVGQVNGTILSTTHIATLPKGFRPLVNMGGMPATGNTAGGVAAVLVTLDTDGKLVIGAQTLTLTHLFLNICVPLAILG